MSEHQGHRSRLRERYEAVGIEGFAEHEILELLLCFAIPRRNVNPLAHRLLKQFGSLGTVLSQTVNALQQVEGVGASAAIFLSLIGQLPRVVTTSKSSNCTRITNHKEASAHCLQLYRGNETDEIFYVLCLDGQGRVLSTQAAFHGTLDEIVIYPRKVLSLALNVNAASVILCHNHPSGLLAPSHADIATTETLRAALSGADIRLLDHILVADGQVLSIERFLHDSPTVTPFRDQPKAADARKTRVVKPHA